MELVKSGTLRDYMEEYLQKNEKISETNASIIVKNILSAVAYLHLHDVVHRDLKPGSPLIFKLLDTS